MNQANSVLSLGDVQIDPQEPYARFFSFQRGAALQKYLVYFKKPQRIWGGKGPQGHGFGGLHMKLGARDYSRAPALFNIPMLPLLPPSVGEADAALGTTASQNLAAVGSGHALTETMDLGAMTLLGLIGTNHAETPPVQIGRAQALGAVPPSTTSRRDAVGKINALNGAHEIIPKSATSVKKNSDIFSWDLPITTYCGKFGPGSQHRLGFRRVRKFCGKFFGYNINKIALFTFSCYNTEVLNTMPMHSLPRCATTGALTLCVKCLGHGLGNGFLRTCAKGGTALSLCHEVRRYTAPGH